jgi:hypothetical protein
LALSDLGLANRPRRREPPCDALKIAVEPQGVGYEYSREGQAVLEGPKGSMATIVCNDHTADGVHQLTRRARGEKTSA